MTIRPSTAGKTDYARLAGFAQRGVALLLADSTNSDKTGWTQSEAVIGDALDRVFRQAKGRIMVATFASLMSRVQQVVNAARNHKRKVCITGYTMSEYAKIARKLGYLNVPDDVLISIGQAQNMRPTRWSSWLPDPRASHRPSWAARQRAPSSIGCARERHHHLSRIPIPGNEEMVYRTIIG